VTADLQSRSKVSGHVFDVINAFPKTAHPMTQLTAGIMALQVRLPSTPFLQCHLLLLPKTSLSFLLYVSDNTLQSDVCRLKVNLQRLTKQDLTRPSEQFIGKISSLFMILLCLFGHLHLDWNVKVPTFSYYNNGSVLADTGSPHMRMQ
jgi:hypothetical protein